MAIIPGTFQTILPKSDRADADDKGKITAELKVRFQFQDDNPDATSFDAYNYPGIPRSGEMYFINGKLLPPFICKGVHATKIVDGLSHWWEVEALYKLIGTPENQDGSTPEYNETTVDISTGTIIVPTVAKYDYFGQKIQNSAGQQFDPPAQYDRRIATYTINRDEFFNPNWKRLEFEGTVNSVSMWGLPPYTVKVNEIKTSKSKVITDDPSKQGEPAWKVSYELAVDTATHGYDKNGNEIYGWQTAVLDCGKMAFDSEMPKLVRIRDDQGLEVDDPQRLDGNGGKLGASAQDVYLRYMLHPLANLNLLNLPNPFMV